MHHDQLEFAFGATPPVPPGLLDTPGARAEPELGPPIPDRPTEALPADLVGAPTLASENLRDDRWGGDQPERTEVKLSANLGEAFAWYDEGVSEHPARAQIRSALRTVSRVLQRPLSDIPASPEQLALLLKGATPGLAGIRPRNWIQTKSLTLRGLRALGVQVAAGRDTTQLRPAWQALHDELPTLGLRIGLSRLLRFMSRDGIAPEDVGPAAFERFKLELTKGSLHPNPGGAYRASLRHWNVASAALPAWPKVTISVPAAPGRYSLDWAQFPKTFLEEMEAFLSQKSNPDPYADTAGYSRPVRPDTTKGRRQNIRSLASAMVLSRRITALQLTGLSVMVEIENVRAALRYVRETNGGDITEGQINKVWLMRTIAKYWLEDEAKAADLKQLIGNMSAHRGRHRAGGITPKNRERLRQFDVPSNLDALVHLPMKVLRKAKQSPTAGYRAAVRVMYALQVGILTFAPIRLKNLTSLELGYNLIDLGKGSKRTVRLHLPSDQIKTRRDYDAPLPPHLFPLLDAWLTIFRPRVCGHPSQYLFPNPRGDIRNREALSDKLSRFIKREVGLKVNTHLFRHIAAKTYLDHDPSGIEVVRQLLGHTSTRTTLRVYAELQVDPAFKRFEQAVLELGAKPARKTRRRGSLGGAL